MSTAKEGVYFGLEGSGSTLACLGDLVGEGSKGCASSALLLFGCRAEAAT